MPDANGFMTPAENRAEWVAAEAALLARRDPAQLAGEATPAEAKQLDAADAKLAAAIAANGAAFRGLVAAQNAPEAWKPATSHQRDAIVEAERALERARRDEEDARRERIELGRTVSAARQARREAAA